MILRPGGSANATSSHLNFLGAGQGGGVGHYNGGMLANMAHMVGGLPAETMHFFRAVVVPLANSTLALPEQILRGLSGGAVTNGSIFAAHDLSALVLNTSSISPNMTSRHPHFPHLFPHGSVFNITSLSHFNLTSLEHLLSLNTSRASNGFHSVIQHLGVLVPRSMASGGLNLTHAMDRDHLQGYLQSVQKFIGVGGKHKHPLITQAPPAKSGAPSGDVGQMEGQGTNVQDTTQKEEPSVTTALAVISQEPEL
jgi:hypothetical protein